MANRVIFLQPISLFIYFVFFCFMTDRTNATCKTDLARGGHIVITGKHAYAYIYKRKRQYMISAGQF